MTYRPSILGIVSLLAGIGLASLEVLGTYEYVTEHPVGLYVAAGSCVATAFTPLLPGLADRAWRLGWRSWSLCAWLLFVVCATFALQAAIQRTGTATDMAQQSRAQAERSGRIASEALTQAKADYDAAQKAALSECAVRGPKCMDAEAKAERLRQALGTARADLAKTPVGQQADALASRFAVYLHISEDTFRLFQPLQLPLIITFLSGLCFAWWAKEFSGAPKPVFPKAEILRPEPARPIQAPKLTLVPKTPLPVKYGDVVAYLVSCTEAAENQDIEIEHTLYNSYIGWCKLGGVEPHSPQQFALELAKIVEAEGLVIEIRGKQAFCLDRRLAA